MRKILVTGATGFIGLALVDSLIDAKHSVVALIREQSLDLPEEVVQVVAEDLKSWSAANSSFESKMKKILPDVDIIIHLAARVHVMTDDLNDPLTEFRAVNVDATLALARIAADIGIKRFIYLSSIGVNGNNTSQPFTERDNPSPHNCYAASKYEAEHGLLALAHASNMEVVVIRPPLVYGPNAPGNFATLMAWMSRGVPLPFGAIHNKRSLVALDNLIGFIIHCLIHPKASNEIFLISDKEDVSTTELLQRVAKGFGYRPWLIPVPVPFMNFIGKLLGKNDVTDKLFASLQVDASKARNLLAWKPVITMDEQLKKTANAYLKNEKNI